MRVKNTKIARPLTILFLLIVLLPLGVMALEIEIAPDTLEVITENSQETTPVMTQDSIPIGNADISSIAINHQLAYEDIRAAQQDSEVINMRVLSMPKIREASSSIRDEQVLLNIQQYIRQMKSSDEAGNAMNQEMRRLPSAALKQTSCRSARTEYTAETAFDCTEGIKKLDNKETPLYASRGKDYAAIEVTFKIPKQNNKAILRIVQDIQFPTQQDVVVYYRDQKNTNNNWRMLCYGLKSGANYCDATPAVQSRKAEFRIEGYSREGPAVWSVNSISLFQSSTSQQDLSMPPAGPAPPLGQTLPCSFPDGCTIPSTTQPPPTILSSDYPLSKIPKTPTTTTSSPRLPFPSLPGSAEGAETPLFEENQSPSPITGAAIARLLRENSVGLGLLLLFIAAVGTLAYRASHSKRTTRK